MSQVSPWNQRIHVTIFAPEPANLRIRAKGRFCRFLKCPDGLLKWLIPAALRLPVSASFWPICHEKGARSFYYLRNVRGLIPSFKLVLQSLRL